MDPRLCPAGFAVHVWELRLDLPPTALARLATFVSAEESLRAGRLVREIHRRRFLAAHGLLRVILAGYVGSPPWDLEFESAPLGKPRLNHARAPRFSLSHTGALGLVAVSPDREVGIDVEEIREIGDLEALAETCLSPAERAALASVSELDRRRTFLELWTRKEAFLKATGEGFSRPPASFDVTLADGRPLARLRPQGTTACYALRTLDALPGHVGAVAVEGRQITVDHRSWHSLCELLSGPLMRGEQAQIVRQ